MIGEPQRVTSVSLLFTSIDEGTSFAATECRRRGRTHTPRLLVELLVGQVRDRGPQVEGRS